MPRMTSRVIDITLLTALVVGVALIAQDAHAAVFDDVKTKTKDIYVNARNIVMIVGAIGVLGLGVMAFFGKFKWTWAASLLGGLALIAFVTEILSYFDLAI